MRMLAMWPKRCPVVAPGRVLWVVFTLSVLPAVGRLVVVLFNRSFAFWLDRSLWLLLRPRWVP